MPLQIDSATAANAATIASINPSTALIILILGVGVIYLLSLLLRNTAITQAIADRMDGDETAELVKAIRADQLTSNAERKAQGMRITAMEGRMDHLERSVLRMEAKCKKMELEPLEEPA